MMALARTLRDRIAETGTGFSVVLCVAPNFLARLLSRGIAYLYFRIITSVDLITTVTSSPT
jgi:hypothetical protein